MKFEDAKGLSVFPSSSTVTPCSLGLSSNLSKLMVFRNPMAYTFAAAQNIFPRMDPRGCDLQGMPQSLGKTPIRDPCSCLLPYACLGHSPGSVDDLASDESQSSRRSLHDPRSGTSEHAPE